MWDVALSSADDFVDDFVDERVDAVLEIVEVAVKSVVVEMGGSLGLETVTGPCGRRLLKENRPRREL